MALTYSQSGKLGSVAAPFSLKGTDDKIYRLRDFSDSQVLIIVFMCNHCPYVQATQGRVNQIAVDYRSKNVSLIGINSNDSIRYPEDSFESMKIRAREEKYVFPYLFDETQETAKTYGAVCTPDFYVFLNEDQKMVLKYRGQLDDSWKDPTKVTKMDLRNAIDKLLAGQQSLADQKPSMGCSIKWKG